MCSPGIREKEAGTFAAYDAESSANLEAMEKAIAAIEKGAGGSFLQTSAAQTLTALVQSKREMNDGDHPILIGVPVGHGHVLYIH